MTCKPSLLYTAILAGLMSSAATARVDHGGSIRVDLSRTPSAAHAPIKAPTGSGVLYDQTAGYSGRGLRVGEFSSSYDSYDSEGADDFVISDDTGWTVSGFNFTAFPTQSAPLPTTAIVTVYRSNVGIPGSTPLCTARDVPTTYDVASLTLGVTLPQPCVLPQGHYWVGFAFGEDANSSAVGNWGQVTNLHNSPAVWRAPHESETTCHAWSTFSACGFDQNGEQDFAFQVFGVVGGSSGGGGGAQCANGQPTCLAVTLAPDDGNTATCGTASTLQVTAGDRVNYCYTYTNASALTLNYHTLSDDLAGTYFANRPEEVAPGKTFQFNRVVTVYSSQSPTSTWISADQLTTYTANAAAPYSFVDITGSGTPLGLGDDDSANVDLPFSFNFYGTTSNQLCINNNGIAFFARGTGCSGYYENAGIPAGGLPALAIAPLWSDLGGDTGEVYTATVGTEPNRQFVVEWNNRTPLGATVTQGFTFEIVFDEASGALSYQYANIDVGNTDFDGGAGASVGLQYSSQVGTQFSHNTNSVPNASAIGWSSGTSTSYTTTAQAQVTAVAATIAVTPGSLGASTPPGGTSTSPLTIANSGNVDLDWSLATAPAASHMRGYSTFTLPQGDPSAHPIGAAPHSKGAVSHARPLVPFGGNGTVAYAEALHAANGDYVRFGLAHPDTPYTVAALTQEAFYGGDFVNNDFTKEYVINAIAGTLETIDTNTGAVTVIGGLAIDGSYTWSGLKWDPTTNVLYAVAVQGNDPYGTRLVTIDINDATVTEIADITGVDSGNGTTVIDIAIDQAGHLYGVEMTGDNFIAIDKTTGVAEVVGSIGFDAAFAEGMDFDDSTGILYFAGYDVGADTGNLYTINLATGHADLIAPTGNADEFDALAIAAIGRGACATPGSVPWLTFDQPSGATPAGGESTVTVTFDATGLGEGTYSANLCVSSNDPLHPSTAVPVTLTVGDSIFVDGFEGGAP